MAPMMRAIGLDSVEAPPVAGTLATGVGALLVTESFVDEVACDEAFVVEFLSGVDMADMAVKVDMPLLDMTLMLPDALADMEPEALGRVPEPPVYWN